MNKDDTLEKSTIKKSIAFTIVIIIVIAGVGLALFFLFRDTEKKDVILEQKNISEIAGYGITLSEKDSKLYKDEFLNLKSILEADNIDYDAYAKSLAKLFIIDLYDINSKVNKYDVGGIEEVYEPIRENYSINVQDTLYKYLEDNTNGEREQELPIVSSISVDSIEKNQFTYKSENVTYDGYKVKLSWSYKYDSGYDKSGEVILINKDDKLYVVEKN